MKTLVTALLLFPLVATAQIGDVLYQALPALSVPYIPVRKAKTTAQIFAEMDAEGAVRYSKFIELVDRVFAEQVTRVDMLVVHKLTFQQAFNQCRMQQNKEVANGAAIALGDGVLVRYGACYDELALNAISLQSARTTYTRVIAWENHLRDKNLLNEPYSNANGPTGLTNKQALNILYGTDKQAYLKLG